MDSDFSNNIENVPMNLKKWNAMSKPDQDIFTSAVQDIKPWIFHETLKYCGEIKGDMVFKGAKIHYLTAGKRGRYSKGSVPYAQRRKRV